MAITNYKPTIWHAALFENLHAAQVVIPTLNREYEGDIKNGGETVKITGFTQPTIRTYAGSITREAMTDSSQEIDIDQQKYYAYLVDDVDKAQAAGSFDEVQKDAAAGLTDTSEAFVIAQMLANGTAGGGTTAITDYAGAHGRVSRLRTLLTKAKVPLLGGGRYLACNPEFVELLLGPGSSLVKVNEAGDDGELRNGVVGKLLGFTILETPAAALANSNKPAAIGYWGRAVGFAEQLVKQRAQTVTDAFGDQVDGLHVYGGKVLRATAVQTYLSA